MKPFQAYRIFEENGTGKGRLVEMALDELDTGDVVIQTVYSSVNYKDALAGTGTGRIVRRYPCVGGIDNAGIVVSSSDSRFKPGDEVICSGYGMGVTHDGGYAAYVRAPADWIVPLPQGLSLFEAMALGTAGFTAALAIHGLEHNGMAPENGKVLVNGASGGVASLAINMLSRRGYRVTAVTGKADARDYLRRLGAAEVLSREALNVGTKPLEKRLWAAAFDSVGGTQLAAVLKTMQERGVVANFGNTGGIELHTTVLPFILRGVKLIGIDAVKTSMPLRMQIWRRLAVELKPDCLDQIVKVTTLEELSVTFDRMLNSQIRGRVVLDI